MSYWRAMLTVFRPSPASPAGISGPALPLSSEKAFQSSGATNFLLHFLLATTWPEAAGGEGRGMVRTRGQPGPKARKTGRGAARAPGPRPRARAPPGGRAAADRGCAARTGTQASAKRAAAEVQREAKRRLKTAVTVAPERWRPVRPDQPQGGGPVVYWCSRDQRAQDNWALLHAAELARARDAQLGVVFNLAPATFEEGARHSCFLLQGLRELEPALRAYNIPFFLLQGAPEDTLPPFLERQGAAALVTDMCPLRGAQAALRNVADRIAIPFHEVDAHNVVPIWEASNKQEYAARTIRPKIHKQLPLYLREMPKLEALPAGPLAAEPVDWDGLLAKARAAGGAVPEVDWIQPGEAAARAALSGAEDSFLTKKRMGLYGKRNDPNVPQALSHLSPYINFGQLGAQRAALEAIKFKMKHSGAREAVDSFLEELIVRRELSDNFCYFNDKYDSVEGASNWAQETLRVHAEDKREHVYPLEKLEAGKTHDELWNAAQRELVVTGKMHGFMRMYWAKKILEWTESPEVALANCLHLNDKYSLDGRNPNGFVGCMWSVCGIHDMGWTERAVFGKIRYMNYNGCKRKFKIDQYVGRIRKLKPAKTA